MVGKQLHGEHQLEKWLHPGGYEFDAWLIVPICTSYRVTMPFRDVQGKEAIRTSQIKQQQALGFD